MGADTKATIREIITEACRKKGISLNKLSILLGSNPAYLHDILSGRKVSRPFIQRIANFLGIPELIPAYEQFLHEKRVASRQVENKAGVSTQEKEGGK